MSDPLNVHLTSKELAKRLRRSTGHLSNMRLAGTGPKFLPGCPVLYPLSEVEKWEQSRLVRSTAEKPKPTTQLRPGFVDSTAPKG